MSKVITCCVNMFSPSAQIFVTEDGREEDRQFLGWASLKGLSNRLYQFCAQQGAEKIHLFGNEDYLLGIVDELIDKTVVEEKGTNFSSKKGKTIKNNSIEVEIN